MTTEREFQLQVMDLARILGWHHLAHFRPARTAHGWRTPMMGDVGFPDLVLVRDRVVFAELKSDTGKLGLGQAEWLEAIREAGGEAYLWRPADLDGEVMRVLGRGYVP